MAINFFYLHYVALAAETFIYGIYCIVFAGSVWVLVKRRRADNLQPISPVIDVCFWLIFITLTIHSGTSIYFRYEGLVVRGSDPLISAFYLIDSSSTPNLIRSATFGMASLFMDVMLIYRLWVIWGRQWAITVLPCALTLFNFAGFVYVLHLCAVTGPLASMDRAVQIWSSVLFSFEASTNLLCAGLIAARIIHNMRISGSVLGQGAMPILWIIVESAAVYTVLTIVIMGGMLMELPWIIPLMDVIPIIAGISSCLLIVRVGFEMASDSVRPREACHSRALSSGRTRSYADNIELKVSVTQDALISRDSGSIIAVKERRRQYRGDSDKNLRLPTPPSEISFSVSYPPSPAADVDVC